MVPCISNSIHLTPFDRNHNNGSLYIFAQPCCLDICIYWQGSDPKNRITTNKFLTNAFYCVLLNKFIFHQCSDTVD